MPYVERNQGGDVKGVYARRQPGRAEELLPDTDPEVMAFRDPPPVPPENTPTTVDDLERATRAVLAPLGVTPADFGAAIVAAKQSRGA